MEYDKLNQYNNELKGNLPDLPSELIDLALNDFILCLNQNNKYEIDFDKWHSPNTPEYTKCFVCFGGCVMAQTLKGNWKKHLDPLCYSENIAMKFLALDMFRLGMVHAGLRLLGLYDCSLLIVERVQIGKTTFIKDMMKLIQLLKDNDL